MQMMVSLVFTNDVRNASIGAFTFGVRFASEQVRECRCQALPFHLPELHVRRRIAPER